MTTIKVKKGLKVPYTLSGRAYLDYCLECKILPSDVIHSVTVPETQIVNLSVLLYHCVKASFDKLNEPIPYSKDEVMGWFIGEDTMNFFLVQAFAAIVLNDIAQSYELVADDEEPKEEDVAENKKKQP